MGRWLVQPTAVSAPYDGLNELLPVATAGEEDHQVERPDEVRAKKDKAIAASSGTIRLNDLACLGPEEIPQPTIDRGGIRREGSARDEGRSPGRCSPQTR